jgi:hypothetical protein
MSLLGLDSWVVRSSEPIAAEVGDGLVMLSVEEGKYFSLNPTAAAIWRRLESPVRIGELCDQIVEEFDISREHAIHAVPAFIAKLLEQKIAAVPPMRPSSGEGRGIDD